MKRLLITLSILMPSVLCGAQDKPDLLEFLKTFNFNISIDEFKERYKNNFHAANEEFSDTTGLYLSDDFSIDSLSVMTGIYFIQDKPILFVHPNTDSTIILNIDSEKILDYLMKHLEDSSISNDSDDEFSKILDILSNINGENGSSTGHQWIMNDKNYRLVLSNYQSLNIFVFDKLSQKDNYHLSRVPIQRQFFSSLRFDSKITESEIAAAVKCYSFDIRKERISEGLKFTVMSDIPFGGHKWNKTYLYTLKDKFYKINLNNNSLYDNSYIFYEMKEVLSDKYGEANSYYDDICFWSDGGTIIFLTYQYAKSNGGEMRHYVDLIYSDIDLSSKARQIVSDEL